KFIKQMEKHRLTIYIELLNEKANSYNKFALCKSYCENFFAIYGEEAEQDILDNTDIEDENLDSNNIDIATTDDDNDNSSIITMNLANLSMGPLDQYAPKKVLSIAQIRGVINQAHRNYELEIIKKIYYSNLVQSYEQDDKDKSNNIENEDTTDSEESEDKVSSNNRSKNWMYTLNLWNRMLELEDKAFYEAQLDDEALIDSYFDEKSVFDYLESQIHPQHDKNAKWKLDSLFVADLGPPTYIEQL
ncbi:5693_t:CDS:2, partial [Dentiscutata erythropus]